MLHYKKTAGDRIFDAVVYLVAVLLIIITLYPLIYTFSMSISDPMEVARGSIWLLPKGFSLKAFETIFRESDILIYLWNTVFYTVVGTVIGVVVTCLAAYPLSRPEFRLRGGFKKFFLFTMFFYAGMIPTYIVITKFLNMYNSRWALLLPPVSAAWYVVVATSFFESLPAEIVESARIDGASEYRIFGQLMLPLSKPVLAVLALYYAVGYWNSYFPGMLYLSDKKLQPLAVYVRSVVIQNSMGNMAATAGQVDVATLLSSIQIKYAVLVVTVLPMLLIYPFLSKNLEKGLMIGAIKG